jgi:short-subunit dehydrogenase
MTISATSVAVITGAAGGIGRALAIRLAEEGIAGIAISDVNEQGLEETAELTRKHDVPVSQHHVDVSRREDLHRFVGEVTHQHGRATHLINNAGVTTYGTFDQLSLADFEWVMGINFWGVVNGTKAFLPTLRAQDRAHIVNMSSVFGLVAPPEQTAYSSSKFAIRGFSDALRHELEGSTVSVSCVHPSGVLTNIAANARVGEKAPAEIKTQAMQLFGESVTTTAATVANAIVRGVKRRHPRILIGPEAHGIDFVARLFPNIYLKVFELLVGHRLDLRKKK